MRNPTLKSLMTRLEKLAKAEYRDIEGQLRYVLDHYESSRPRPIVTEEAKPKRKYTKRVETKAEKRPAFTLTSPDMPKQRKPRSDIGKKRKAYNMTKSPSERKPRGPRAPLSAQAKKNISMGMKLAAARRKLAKLTDPVGDSTS